MERKQTRKPYVFAGDFETYRYESKYFERTKTTTTFLASLVQFECSTKNVQVFAGEACHRTMLDYLWKFVSDDDEQIRENIIIYFHNASFDISFIIGDYSWSLNNEPDGYWKGWTINGWDLTAKTNKVIDIIQDTSGIYEFKMTKKVKIQGKSRTRSLIFRDSLKFFPMSLERIGKSVGLAKLDGDKAITRLDEVNDISDLDRDEIDYCVRDSEIVALAMQTLGDFLERDDLDGKKQKRGRTRVYTNKLTLPSVAFHEWKHLNWLHSKGKTNYFSVSGLYYHDFKIIYHGASTSYNELLISPVYDSKNSRKALPKGYPTPNTEIFSKKLYKHDVNSLYPSLMVLPMPYGDVLSEKPLEPHIEFYSIMIYSLKCRDDLPAVYSYKHEKMRECNEPHQIIIYKKEWDVLNEFYAFDYEIMKTFYMLTADFGRIYTEKYFAARLQFKKDGNFGFESVTKAMQVAPYGKLAQSPIRESTFYTAMNYEKGQRIKKYLINAKGEEVAKEYEVTTRHRQVVTGMNCYSAKPVEVPRYVNNFFAGSWITCQGRVKIFEAILANPKTIVYWDTDSLISTAPVKGIEVDNYKLGAWKDEFNDDKIRTKFVVFAPKKYRTFFADGSVDMSNSKFSGVMKKHDLSYNVIMGDSENELIHVFKDGKLKTEYHPDLRGTILKPIDVTFKERNNG